MEPEHETLKDRFSKILLGFVVGVFITLALFLVVNIVSNSNKPVSRTPEKILKLELNSPNENLATSDKTVTISGNTGIKSIVTLSSGKQSKIIEVIGSSFSSSLDLTEGKNVITVTAFDPTSGESQQTSREILYLTEDLANL